MSESSPDYSSPAQQRTEADQARADIESAIIILRANKSYINSGQEDAIKRIIYGAPRP